MFFTLNFNVGQIKRLCVSKNCIYKGLNTSNKGDDGVCTKCGNFEHFGCVKIKTEDRDDITKGNMKYFCSNCFSKNPSIGIHFTPSIKTTKPRTILTHSKVFASPATSAPVQPTSFKISGTTTATPLNDEVQTEAIVHKEPEVAPETTKENCGLCTLEGLDKTSLDAHMLDVHAHQFIICDKKEKTKEDLEQHIQDEHTFPCEYFSDKSVTEADDQQHKEKNHVHPCAICEEKFVEKTSLTKHMQTKVNNNSELKHMGHLLQDWNSMYNL